MKKNKPAPTPKPQCFLDEDEESPETTSAQKNPSSKKFTTHRPAVTSIELADAISNATDPTVTEFDSIYDEDNEMKQQKKTVSASKGPKYAQALMRTAEKRKQEHDRIAALQTIQQRYTERGLSPSNHEELVFVTEAYAAAIGTNALANSSETQVIGPSILLSGKSIDSTQNSTQKSSHQSYINDRIQKLKAAKEEMFIEKYLKIVSYLTSTVTAGDLQAAKERYEARQRENS